MKSEGCRHRTEMVDQSLVWNGDFLWEVDDRKASGRMVVVNALKFPVASKRFCFQKSLTH
jgi:hypothetical protein